MKIFVSLLLTLSVLFSCKNESSNGKTAANALAIASDTAHYTTIQWIDSLKDVGRLNFGETASINFKFKNTGDKPLFVIKAEPGCGCTVTDYPKEAIAPGKEGVISAAFDTNKGSEGEFRKNIMVTTNTVGSTSQVLYFMGTIVKDDKKTSASH